MCIFSQIGAHQNGKSTGAKLQSTQVTRRRRASCQLKYTPALGSILWFLPTADGARVVHDSARVTVGHHGGPRLRFDHVFICRCQEQPRVKARVGREAFRVRSAPRRRRWSCGAEDIHPIDWMYPVSIRVCSVLLATGSVFESQWT